MRSLKLQGNSYYLKVYRTLALYLGCSIRLWELRPLILWSPDLRGGKYKQLNYSLGVMLSEASITPILWFPNLYSVPLAGTEPFTICLL